MLVVGARGLGGFSGLLLGSVSQRCLHGAIVPTVIVRAGAAREPTGTVVVGIDGSPHADAALRWALDEARRRSAALTVVHTYPAPLTGGPLSAMQADSPALGEAAARLTTTAIAAAGASGVETTALVVCGSAAGALVEAGDRADLVVVGSRGRGAVSRLLLGSVATQVVQHARGPVVVVPSPTAPPRDERR
jgi:nucleotide-binding universal stress UspA family protein